MITIFTTPKPFRGRAKITQTNTIMSWIKLRPKVRIVLVGNEYGTKAIAEKYGLCHIKQVERNQFGTPLVKSVFKTGEENTPDRILAYVNADVILFENFITTIKKVRGKFDKFLIIGRRTDMDIGRYIDFNDQIAMNSLIGEIRSKGKMHGVIGIDYLIYSKGLWGDIPPFALGRPVYDHWMVWRARQKKAAVIDATECLTALHQNHNYNHVGGGYYGKRYQKEMQINQLLAGERKMTIADANYTLTNHDIIRRGTLQRDIILKLRPVLNSRLVQNAVKIKAKFGV